MEVSGGFSDMISGVGVIEKVCCWTLGVLELVVDFGEWTLDEPVTVNESRNDKSENGSFRGEEGDWRVNASNVWQIEKGSCEDIADVVLKNQINVKN